MPEKNEGFTNCIKSGTGSRYRFGKAALVLFLLILALVLPGCSGISLEPDDSGAYDEAVKALGNGDYDTAVQKFIEADEIDGRTAESLRGQGLVAYERGNYKDAIDLFDRCLEAMRVKNPEFVEDVKYYKADCLAKINETTEAEVLYEELLKGTKPYLAHVMLGRIYMSRGEAQKAKLYFDSALEENPDYSAYLVIYDAYDEAHLEADGADYLKLALELEPKTAKDHADLGRIYAILEEYDSAKEHLQIAVDAGYDEAVSVLGGIYLDEGDISAARALYEKEIRSGSRVADGYNGLALCELAQNNPENALRYIEEGLNYEDDSARKSLLFNQVLAYEAMRDFDTALYKANEFLLHYPNDERMMKEKKFLSQ